ncbi:MAG: hypothetical protein GXO58_05310 [Thermodesulfobacteria bacterium]|nr:hypothetical protein [Thermodesulfobacteriota bacterium]
MKHLPTLLLAAGLILLGGILVPGVGYALDARYKVILAKNPFDPERGGGVNGTEESGGVASGKEFAEKYAVYGVVIAGNSRYAFLKPVAAPRFKARHQEDVMRKVTEGDLVDGWKVKEIKSDGVLFVKAGKSEFIRVFGTTKKERSSSKPVGVATPRPKTPRPTPKVNNRNKPSSTKGRQTEVFVVPDGKNNKNVKKSFLKALMDIKKRQQEERRKKGVR